jgi:hypothetical protein
MYKTGPARPTEFCRFGSGFPAFDPLSSQGVTACSIKRTEIDSTCRQAFPGKSRKLSKTVGRNGGATRSVSREETHERKSRRGLSKQSRKSNSGSRKMSNTIRLVACASVFAIAPLSMANANGYRCAPSRSCYRPVVSCRPICHHPVRICRPVCETRVCTPRVCERPVYTPPVCETPVYTSPVCETPVYTPPVCETPVYTPPVCERPVYCPPVKRCCEAVCVKRIYTAPVCVRKVYSAPVCERIYRAPVCHRVCRTSVCVKHCYRPVCHSHHGRCG